MDWCFTFLVSDVSALISKHASRRVTAVARADPLEEAAGSPEPWEPVQPKPATLASPLFLSQPVLPVLEIFPEPGARQAEVTLWLTLCPSHLKAPIPNSFLDPSLLSPHEHHPIGSAVGLPHSCLWLLANLAPPCCLHRQVVPSESEACE